MRKDSNINIDEMYDVASEFYYCGELCRTSFGREGIPDRVLIVPEAVNYAFACEIFLKILLLISNIPYTYEHKLENLFNKLPDKYKNEIIDLCDKEYKGDREPFNMQFLSNVSSAFEKWRYCYEKENPPLKIGFLFIFSKILKEKCSREMFFVQ